VSMKREARVAELEARLAELEPYRTFVEHMRECCFSGYLGLTHSG